jgi:uncharacterized protein YjbI with pentapeptide repeats
MLKVVDWAGKSSQLTRHQVLGNIWDYLVANAPLLGALLALAGVLITQIVTTIIARSAQRTQQGVEERRARASSLQSYLEQMGRLLTDHRPHNPKPDEDAGTDDARKVARAQTLSVLNGLGTDSTRKGILLQFLYESALIDNKDAPLFVSLARANLREATLVSGNLSGAILSETALHGALLKGAILSGANLRGAIMMGTILSDADLSEANLSGADLNDADLSGAVLNDADLRGANLSKADLRGYLYGTNLSGAILSYTNLRGANLRGAILRNVDLRGANLRGADLGKADLSRALLSDASLSEVPLRGAFLAKATLYGANLKAAILGKTILNGANLIGADLSEANLSGATVTEEQLRTCQSLEGAIMPDGSKHA